MMMMSSIIWPPIPLYGYSYGKGYDRVVVTREEQFYRYSSSVSQDYFFSHGC